MSILDKKWEVADTVLSELESGFRPIVCSSSCSKLRRRITPTHVPCAVRPSAAFGGPKITTSPNTRTAIVRDLIGLKAWYADDERNFPGAREMLEYLINTAERL